MDAEWIRWILGGLLGVILLVFGGILQYIIRALGGKAGKESTDARFAELIKQLDRHIESDERTHSEVLEEFRASGKRLDETNRHLTQTNVTLATLAGRFDGHIQRNGDRT